MGGFLVRDSQIYNEQEEKKEDHNQEANRKRRVFTTPKAVETQKIEAIPLVRLSTPVRARKSLRN